MFSFPTSLTSDAILLNVKHHHLHSLAFLFLEQIKEKKEKREREREKKKDTFHLTFTSLPSLYTNLLSFCLSLPPIYLPLPHPAPPAPQSHTHPPRGVVVVSAPPLVDLHTSSSSSSSSHNSGPLFLSQVSSLSSLLPAVPHLAVGALKSAINSPLLSVGTTDAHTTGGRGEEG